MNLAKLLGSDRCRRQGDLQPELPATRRAGSLRHHGSRRGDRRRGLAAASGAGAGRAGRRRRPVRGTRARRFLDGAPSYDPELNLVYVGTSVTSPAPQFLLGGIENNYLYHNSTLALDGDTADLVLPAPERIAALWNRGVDEDALEGVIEVPMGWIDPRLTPGETRAS